jgi:hypothetical protein
MASTWADYASLATQVQTTASLPPVPDAYPHQAGHSQQGHASNPLWQPPGSIPTPNEPFFQMGLGWGQQGMAMHQMPPAHHAQQCLNQPLVPIQQQQGPVLHHGWQQVQNSMPGASHHTAYPAPSHASPAPMTGLPAVPPYHTAVPSQVPSSKF